MTDREKTEVHLQITSGVLRLSTDDAVYYISAPTAPEPIAPHSGENRRMLPERLEAHSSIGSMGAPPSPMVTIDPALSGETSLSEEQAASARKAQKESKYYQTLARKYHQSLGLLARQVASGLGAAEPLKDGGAAGPRNIEDDLDRLAALRAEGNKIQDLLASFSGLEIMTEEEKQSLADEINRSTPVPSGPAPFSEKCLTLDNSALALLNRISEALQQTASAPPPPPPPPPKKESKTVKHFFFPLNDLFQIVYELAIGEEVKKAIKVVWDGMAEFDEAQLNKSLHPLSQSFEIDDGFVLVPLEPLFKSLFLASNNEAYRSTIKKLNANREKLFLDQSLPVEERYQEVQEEVALAAPPSPPSQVAQPPFADLAGLKAEVDGFKEKLAAHLEELKNSSAKPGATPVPSPVAGQLLSWLIIRNGGAKNLVQGLASAEELMAEHLTGLQEMDNTLKLLADPPTTSSPAGPSTNNGLMLQLLNILVEFHTRLGLSADYLASGGAAIEGVVGDKIADLKKKLGLSSDAGQDEAKADLDQKILNFILSDMGF